MIEPAPVFIFRNEADRNRLRHWCETVRNDNKKLVFTNGVFDILHAGHANYLTRARTLGDALIIGLSSDTSVQRIKGPMRPIQLEEDRANLLAALKATDAVA